MKQRFFSWMMIAILCIIATNVNAQNYKKETYENDPMNVIHYTLDNGLQVFLSVNKDVPRIQTYIAVRVGSKNDPSESTGLSHYLDKNFLSGVGKMNVSVIISFIKIALFFPVAIALIKLWASFGLIMAILVVNTLPNMVFGIYQYYLIISHKAKGIWNR